MKEKIEQIGGIKYLSEKYDIPKRTLEDWYYGKRNPPKWVLGLIERIEDGK